MTTRPNITETLEALVNATSLLDVVTALVCVCSEKSALLSDEDRQKARTWNKAASELDVSVTRITRLGI